jgi:hypothetical protein
MRLPILEGLNLLALKRDEEGADDVNPSYLP